MASEHVRAIVLFRNAEKEFAQYEEVSEVRIHEGVCLIRRDCEGGEYTVTIPLDLIDSIETEPYGSP